MSTLPVLFPPHERTRAIAIWSASVAVGLPLGPIVGGWLLDHFWWGSIFLLNVPFVAVAMLAVGLLLPESRDPAPARVDGVGASLSVAGLAALIYGVIQAHVDGWSDPVVAVSLGAGVTLIVAFVSWEHHVPHPMMDLRIFRGRGFLWATVAATLVSFVLMGVLFVTPQLLQVVQGNDAFGTGLRLLPMTLGLVAGAVATDRLSGRAGHKVIMVTGLFVLAAGLGWGGRTDPGAGYGFTAAWFTVVGLGTGLSLVPAMDLLMAAFPPDRTGVGSGLVQSLRQAGGALGVAGLGNVLATNYGSRVRVDGLPSATADTARESVGGAASIAARLGDGPLLRSAQAAYAAAMDEVLIVCAVAAVAGAVLTWMFLPGGPAGRPQAGDHAGESEYDYAAS